MSLLVAVAWLPGSIALAGNLALNFSGGRGFAWMTFSLVAVCTATCSLAWAVVACWLAARRRASTA
ncbi:hypothetical protein ACFOLC_05530 [Lysobacter cavernae]|uniref:Uncharacterized protein n=1 Tax=Lysobacter cavernae TaxID=1685901 RepID=A0ABV7RNZ4_9GAMM